MPVERISKLEERLTSSEKDIVSVDEQLASHEREINIIKAQQKDQHTDIELIKQNMMNQESMLKDIKLDIKELANLIKEQEQKRIEDHMVKPLSKRESIEGQIKWLVVGGILTYLLGIVLPNLFK